MVDQIVGNAEILLTDEEAELYARQVEAARTADVWKHEADYQNEPKGGEQCDGCKMFVPGFDSDPGGYCTKVRAVRGPVGMIFADGWCKFFEAAEGGDDDE